MVLTHARGDSDENLVFAWSWNITLAEFDRLANFGNEDCFLLSCHVLIIVVSVILVLLSGCWPILSLMHTTSRYLYRYHCKAHMQHCITTSHLAFAPHYKHRVAKQPRQRGFPGGGDGLCVAYKVAICRGSQANDH